MRQPATGSIHYTVGCQGRALGWLIAVFVLALAHPASAQEWQNFASVEDGFEANFPGRPEVANTTWVTAYGYELPARVYGASRGAERYSATVVDYRGIEKLGVERAAHCHPEAEPCLGTSDGADGAIMGLGYWKMDVRGAPAYATQKFLQGGGTVTHYSLQFQQVVEGYLLRKTNPDQSQTMAYITMHENRLYIFEGTTPKGAPIRPILQSSIGFLDADGNSLRYRDYYSNAIHGLRQQEPPAATTERSGALVGAERGNDPGRR